MATAFKFNPDQAQTYRTSTVPAGINVIKESSKNTLTVKGKVTDYKDWWTGDAADGFKDLLKNANTAIEKVLDKLQDDLDKIIAQTTKNYEDFESAQKSAHQNTTWS